MNQCKQIDSLASRDCNSKNFPYDGISILSDLVAIVVAQPPLLPVPWPWPVYG